jgi:glycosyltransferase involved in cell wall biosynthesis
MTAVLSPWDVPLADRVAMLTQAPTRVAYLLSKPDFGTSRYRAFNAVAAINESGADISASYFLMKELDVVDDLSELADIVVLVRVPFDAIVDRLIRRFTRRQKTVVFDIDDFLIDVNSDTLVASNLGDPVTGEPLYRWSAFIANWNKSLQRADLVFTTTPFLKASLGAFTDKPIHVIPNTLNREQIDWATHATLHPGSAKGLRMGYFSGSVSHSRDFDVVRHALAAFLAESPHSRFTLVGHLELPAEFAAFGERVRVLPFMDYLKMQDVLAEIDLAIVPLQESRFTHSKSELKFFEAALASTPILASRNPVFADVIRHGENGFLTDPSGWLGAFREIENMSPDERASVAATAHADALRDYSPEALWRHLSAVLTQRP